VILLDVSRNYRMLVKQFVLLSVYPLFAFSFLLMPENKTNPRAEGRLWVSRIMLFVMELSPILAIQA